MLKTAFLKDENQESNRHKVNKITYGPQKKENLG